MSGLSLYGMTDTGLRRDNNEDAIACLPEQGLAMVADGMGGHNAGEVASAAAVSVICEAVAAVAAGAAPEQWEQVLREAIAEANRQILERARLDPACAGMGTTLVLMRFYPQGALFAHVGDSRIYRVRRGQLQQLTSDHSLVQELVDSGFLSETEARASMNKNLITRALGIADTVEADLRNLATEPGDLYLLCSDGLTDLVPEADIRELLLERGENLESAVPSLIRLANERGGLDNISVILARVEADAPPARAKKK